MPDALAAEPSPRSLGERMFDEIDSSILVLFRVVLGVTVYFWADSFLVDDKYVAIFLEPRFLFKYSGFEWIKLWPGEGIYWHFAVTKIAAICLVLGLLTRISAALLSLAIAYVLMVESQIYVNHYYLLSCAAALLVFLPSGRRFSIDSRLGWERTEKTIPRWQFWLLRFQLGLPYVGGAIAKLNSDWLAGQPAGLIVSQRTEMAFIGPLLALPGATEVFAYGGLLYDLLVVPMLLYRRTRWLAVVLSLIFHLTNAYTLMIGVFPWFMLATLVVFFPAETIATRTRIFLGQPRLSEQDKAVLKRPARRFSRAGLALAGSYVVIQLLLPIRPWIMPGDANWNERGHRFAWRMMLRHKVSMTHFLLMGDQRDDYLYVPSTLILTNYQARRAGHHPEWIRQTAVELSKMSAEFGAPNTRVYALALVSLNGRRPKPVVDPSVDLTKVTRHWIRDDWETKDAGPLLDPPWSHPKEQWWKLIELPAPFAQNLQGKTPSELQAYLDQLDGSRTNAGLQAKDVHRPRGNPNKYWQYPDWLSNLF